MTFDRSFLLQSLKYCSASITCACETLKCCKLTTDIILCSNFVNFWTPLHRQTPPPSDRVSDTNILTPRTAHSVWRLRRHLRRGRERRRKGGRGLNGRPYPLCTDPDSPTIDDLVCEAPNGMLPLQVFPHRQGIVWELNETEGSQRAGRRSPASELFDRQTQSVTEREGASHVPPSRLLQVGREGKRGKRKNYAKRRQEIS